MIIRQKRHLDKGYICEVLFTTVTIAKIRSERGIQTMYSLTLADIPGRLFSEREEPYLQGLSSRWNREEDENNEPQCQVKR